jgi:hypothetical protein
MIAAIVDAERNQRSGRAERAEVGRAAGGAEGEAEGCADTALSAGPTHGRAAQRKSAAQPGRPSRSAMQSRKAVDKVAAGTRLNR